MDGENAAKELTGSSGAQIAVFAAISVFLVLFAGLMSGLTLGLLSMEEVELRVIEKTGSPRQQQRASKVINLIRKPHWLLVTLLLCNAVAMEALPVVLDRLVSPVCAVLISVTAVLFFGEIFPQAICKAKGLAIGAWSAPLVHVLMFMLSPIAWPVSKLLDYVLDRCEDKIDERTHMQAEVQVRRERGQLTIDEETVICGALELSRKTCSVCMTPLEKVRALSENAVLDAPTLAWIQQTGHSRIPVYPEGEPQNLNRVLLVKTLLCYNPEEAAPVSSFKLTPIVRVSEKTRPYQLLDHFQTGRSHMAAVFPSNDSSEALGIITLEDVIEELTQEEIVDETDQFVHVEAPSLGIAEDWRMQCNLRTPLSNLLTPLSRNLGKAASDGSATPALDP